MSDFWTGIASGALGLLAVQALACVAAMLWAFRLDERLDGPSDRPNPPLPNGAAERVRETVT